MKALINSGRRAAERLMLDHITIDRVTSPAADPMTGKDIPEYMRVYEGKGKIQSFAGYEESREVISHSAVVQRMTVHLPVGAYQASVGDVVTIVDSTVDPMLNGRKFRITQEAPIKTFATAYRIFVDYKAE
jgi:hypothetical protein